MFVPRILGRDLKRIAKATCQRHVDLRPGKVHCKRSLPPLSSESPFASVAQSVEQGTENPRVGGSIPPGGTKYADVAHLVERHLAKVEVASSSLVTRSNFLERFRSRWCHSQVVRQSSAKAPLPSSNLGGTSNNRQSSSRRLPVLFFPVLSGFDAAIKEESYLGACQTSFFQV